MTSIGIYRGKEVGNATAFQHLARAYNLDGTFSVLPRHQPYLSTYPMHTTYVDFETLKRDFERVVALVPGAPDHLSSFLPDSPNIAYLFGPEDGDLDDLVDGGFVDTVLSIEQSARGPALMLPQAAAIVARHHWLVRGRWAA